MSSAKPTAEQLALAALEAVLRSEALHRETQLAARLDIEGDDFIRIVEADEHATVLDHWLEDPIVLHQILVQRIIPRWVARSVLT